ncbi:MAG: hypothetical protein HUU02_08195 [Bacteroidetes bacterium]|nr:hypothetical protein [Bacteroidota bacterium]
MDSTTADTTVSTSEAVVPLQMVLFFGLSIGLLLSFISCIPAWKIRG